MTTTHAPETDHPLIPREGQTLPDAGWFITKIEQAEATILDLDRRVGWLEEHLAQQALVILNRARQEAGTTVEDSTT